ncbi:MAG: hypothetical protein GMKNLPBB_00768 [Myxococcota bacterium]|nr:hypothetical protein [Myxococcota bacterium]
MKRGGYWPWLLGGALALHSGGMIAMAVTANRDPSVAYEEDYYRKALNWDQHMAQEVRNRELGWTLSLENPGRASMKENELRVRLLDGAGLPLHGAQITLEAFPVARSGQKIAVTFRESPRGDYLASARLSRPGLWEYRFTVRRGEDIFTSVQRPGLGAE